MYELYTSIKMVNAKVNIIWHNAKNKNQKKKNNVTFC